MSGIRHPHGTSASHHAHETGHSTSHGRHSAHPAHGRGQFGGYTFRIGRAPMQTGPRRASPLRPRPSAQQTQSTGDEMLADIDLSQRAGSSDLDDDERRRPPPIEETGQKGAQQQDDQPPAPPPPRLKVRLPPATAAAPPLAARLRQAGWPGADVLWSHAQQRPTDTQLVQALVAGLLAAALPAAARPAAAGSGTVLRMALMAAFLRTGASAQELSTLAKVKGLAMSRRAAQAPRPRDTPPTETECSANVLAIPELLIQSRLRTATQRKQAIDRLDVLSRSPSMQGTRK